MQGRGLAGFHRATLACMRRAWCGVGWGTGGRTGDSEFVCRPCAAPRGQLWGRQRAQDLAEQATPGRMERARSRLSDHPEDGEGTALFGEPALWRAMPPSATTVAGTAPGDMRPGSTRLKGLRGRGQWAAGLDGARGRLQRAPGLKPQVRARFSLHLPRSSHHNSRHTTAATTTADSHLSMLLHCCHCTDPYTAVPLCPQRAGGGAHPARPPAAHPAPPGHLPQPQRGAQTRAATASPAAAARRRRALLRVSRRHQGCVRVGAAQC